MSSSVSPLVVDDADAADVDRLGRQPLRRDLERRARARRVLEEQVDDGAAAQRRQLLDRLVRERPVAIAVVEDPHDLGGVEVGDADQVARHARSYSRKPVLWSRRVRVAVDRIGQVIGQRFRIDALIGRGAMADVYRALDLADRGVRRAQDPAHSARRRSVGTRRGSTREAEVQARAPPPQRRRAARDRRHRPQRAVPRRRAAARQDAARRAQAGGPGRPAPRRELRVAGAAGPRPRSTRAGVLHRDLKPANIMLEPSPGPIERVVLIDFGFATFEGSAKLTQQGTVVGSLRYIAPERLRGERDRSPQRPLRDRRDPVRAARRPAAVRRRATTTT